MKRSIICLLMLLIFSGCAYVDSVLDAAKQVFAQEPNSARTSKRNLETGKKTGKKTSKKQSAAGRAAGGKSGAAGGATAGRASGKSAAGGRGEHAGQGASAGGAAGGAGRAGRAGEGVSGARVMIGQSAGRVGAGAVQTEQSAGVGVAGQGSTFTTQNASYTSASGAATPSSTTTASSTATPSSTPNTSSTSGTPPHTIAHIEQEKWRAKIPFRRIAFVGDSHVAGDFMSEYFRKALGIHALGFIPPALPKYHRQALANYELSGGKIKYLINAKKLDFAGISLECEQDCKSVINLAFTPPHPRALINDELRELAPSPRLEIHAKAGDIIGGVLSAASEFVDNLGINGASVFNYQRIRRGDIASKLGYDLVIFSFGTNESVASSVNEEQIIAKMREIFARFPGAKKLLLLPPEPVLYRNQRYELGASTERVFAALKRAAASEGALVFDIRQLQRSEGGRAAWRSKALSQANTHLSARGYKYVAQKLLEFLAK